MKEETHSERHENDQGSAEIWEQGTLPGTGQIPEQHHVSPDKSRVGSVTVSTYRHGKGPGITVYLPGCKLCFIYRGEAGLWELLRDDEGKNELMAGCASIDGLAFYSDGSVERFGLRTSE